LPLNSQFAAGKPIFYTMLKPFEFCLPTSGTRVPSGPQSLHEIKYDGYRLRVDRGGDRVRLITRGGYDWAMVRRIQIKL
jgi:ATP-dependent DNA ligase